MVACDPWSVHVTSEDYKPLAWRTDGVPPRLVQTFLYMRADADDNHYAHPVRDSFWPFAVCVPLLCGPCGILFFVVAIFGVLSIHNSALGPFTVRYPATARSRSLVAGASRYTMLK